MSKIRIHMNNKRTNLPISKDLNDAKKYIISTGTRNIGELVFTSLPVMDAGLHLLDGALINGNGIYSDFVDYIDEIYTENSPHFYHDKYEAKEFKAPILSYYNMIGGDYFAVWASNSYNYGSYRPHKAFDNVRNNTNNTWISKSGVLTEDFVFYNPKPLHMTELKVTNSTDGFMRSGTLYASHNGRTWVILKEFTNNNTTNYAQWSIDLSNNKEYYKWYKIKGTSAASYLRIMHLDIVATYKNENNKDVEFVQPVMNDDIPPGTNEFGIYAGSRYADSSYPAYLAFDASDTTYCLYSTKTNPSYFYIYNPDPINIKRIRFGTYSNYNIKTVKLYGFNEANMEWELVGEDTNSTVNAAGLKFTLNFDTNENYYKTYRLHITDAYQSGSNGFGKMEIFGTVEPVLKTAYEQYHEDITKYGCCGKFIYDKKNRTVRLPKLNGILSATNESREIGKIDRDHYLEILAGYGYKFYDNTTYPLTAGKLHPQNINYQYLYIVLASDVTATNTYIDLNNIANELNDKISRAELTEVVSIIETYNSETSWYRLYSDGWCEQGGLFGTAYQSYTHLSITFLKPFKDTNYIALANSAHTGDLYYTALREKTKDHVTFSNTYNTYGIGNWYACGYVEQ